MSNITVWNHSQNAEEYESWMSELFTSIKWDQGTRGVGQWNDPLEFLECLLENMEVDLAVSNSAILLLFFSRISKKMAIVIGSAFSPLAGDLVGEKLKVLPEI